ncbi:hypothetical protein LWHH1689_0134 [Limosilactobacillus reuteri]|uniref:DUF951 domain-containing protein n=1 Tax=Limosilactobacillus reuteri TaxID=1598 RepID=A0A2S1ENG2_LIMRT|nr:DUF951 domain-containing protein [Limosilactobacillus reuteri]AWD61500.1 hypothetical protein LWHH1689_0134 [Limosilactobacillus reuteri]
MAAYDKGDIVMMKKAHPCGTNRWKITRVGADIKIECQGCGHIVMVTRQKFDKGLKKVIEKADQDD